MRRSLLLAIVLVATGCVGKNHSFKSEHEFQSYIDGLHLQSMPIDRAATALIDEGFKCESDGVVHTCERIYNEGYGTQWHRVRLVPDPVDATRTKVSVSLPSLVI